MTVKIERRLLSMPMRPVRLRQDEPKPDDPAAMAAAEDAPPENALPAGDEPLPDEDNPDPEEEEVEGAADESSNGQLEGYAAVFHAEGDPGTEYELWADPSMRAVERIARGAFRNAIQEGDDVRALLNHNSDALLGRTMSGTLRISEDEQGLAYSVDLPDTQLGKDVSELVDRGDISGSSFGFIVEQESWREDEIEGGMRLAIRTIESVRLLDVGPVTYPAYGGTSVASARSALAGGCVRAVGDVSEARMSYKRWKAEQRNQIPLAAKLAAVRARAIEVS
jgi:HK97 family phage prohead protease